MSISRAVTLAWSALRTTAPAVLEEPPAALPDGMAGFLGGPEVAPAAGPVGALQTLLDASGVPYDPTATSAEAEALSLLTLVAEVEHALMVQYLYAMFAFPRRTVLADQPFRRLRSIAVQEMGHLMSVQNLLLLVGGPSAFHLGRDTVRASNPANPLPLVLAGGTAATLAKFAVVEAPAEIPLAFQTQFQHVRMLGDAEANAPLHRVGALYVALLWLFRPEEDSLTLGSLTLTKASMPHSWRVDESKLTADAVIAGFEALDDWQFSAAPRGFVLDPARKRGAAFDLLHRIAVQGEGPTNQHDSHFEQFMALITAVEVAVAAKTLKLVSLAQSPVTAANSMSGGLSPTLIGLASTNRWALLTNVRYEMLLLSLAHALSVGNSGQIHDDLVGLAEADMHLIAHLATYLITLPMTAATGSDQCGPPFELPMGVGIAQGATDAETWGQHTALLVRATDLHAQIQGQPVDPAGVALLNELAAADDARRVIVARNSSPSGTPTRTNT